SLFPEISECSLPCEQRRASASNIPNVEGRRCMTTVIITRHGHVEGIDPPRFRGQTQLTLTRQGRQEAALVAEYIASTWRPAAVRTSPLERCAMTGARIAQACSLLPTVVEGLVDLNYGEWQGKTHEEVRKRWPQLYALWKTSPHLARFP